MNDEITPHLKVVQHPNPKMRSFHVVREVGDISHMYGFGKENMYGLGLLEKNDPGELAKTLAKRLGDLPGVTNGHLRQYEITVGIGDAFSWKDIGPLVLGEIVRSLYPEVDGKTLDISVALGWSYFVRAGGMSFMDEDDGHRTRYQDTLDHEPVPVDLGSGRPRFDIEHLLNGKALDEAKQKASQETVYE